MRNLSLSCGGILSKPPARRRSHWRIAVLVTCGLTLVTSCGPGSLAAVASKAAPRPVRISASGYSGDPGKGWELTWSDDFRGTGALRDWNFDDGGDGWGNRELEVNDPSNVTLAPGGLVITAKRDGLGKQCWYGPCVYSAARLDTQGMFEQEYGLFEARIKLPAGHGLWPAFWMEGGDIDRTGWPAAGEIDVIEVNNKKPDLVESYLHAPEENYGAYYQLPQALSAGYHVYAIDWTSSGISWLVDGHTFGHVSAYSGWPFSQPFFIILDVAVGGTWPGPPNSKTKFPARMDISWIRVYRHKAS
jgi:beta-glucanase (GH16 family)